MNNQDQEFLKRIQETFRIEAKEHLQAFTEMMINFEKEQSVENQTIIIESLFREIHSLKGAARSVGQKDIESVCQPLETLFSALKRKEISITANAIDLIFKSKEILSYLILSSEISKIPGGIQSLRDLNKQLIEETTIKKTDEINDKDEKVEQIHKYSNESSKSNISDTNPVIISTSQTDATKTHDSDNNSEERIVSKHLYTEVVKIPLAKLDPLLLQAEEFLQSKIIFSQHQNELKRISNEISGWKSKIIKRRRSRTIPSSAQVREWQNDNEMQINKLEANLNSLSLNLAKDIYSFDRNVNDHLDSIKQVLMLPVSTLVEVFPGMVREISKNLEKEIEFVIIGSNLEIDKRILEELRDPLTHLIRNSIDHGIEESTERLIKQKTAIGTITLSFSAKESGLLEVSVSDDGKGINKEKILKSALKAKIITPENIETLNHDEVISLILQSGVSTSSIITELSGRGIGMSIVREKIERLNGRLYIESTENKGTTFRILLPMSLATFRGTLVQVDEFSYILPSMNIEQVIRVKQDEITTIENYETITVNNEVLSLVSLADTIGLPQRPKIVSRTQTQFTESNTYQRIIVLKSGENKMAFKVDGVLDEQQVLVKGLGMLLKRVRNISGATILGSGKIVPVLHVNDLFKSALRAKTKIRIETEEETAKQKIARILVAEDSITSRTMLKNILENAGYIVTVAVDGADAFTKAKSQNFDLILSDIDMPKMNGFELTVKIKNDAKLGELPVVLCTSLESREDKERGVEAGADAYIVKNSFDQGNLLEIIKRLI